MSLQRISRHNGSAIIGDLECIVGPLEVDFDPMAPDGSSASGRFRHSFELYSGSLDDAETKVIVLIIEFHYDWQGTYRDGFIFNDLSEMREFVAKFDPCTRLRREHRSAEEIELLNARFARRLEYFLDVAAEMTS